MNLDWIYKFLQTIFERIDNLSKKMQSRRGWSLALNLALIGIVLVVVGNYLVNQWSSIQNIGISLDPAPFFFSLGLYGINYILFVLAWSLLISVFSGAFSLLENALIYSYSQLARLLPTPAWFIAGRVMMYKKEGLSKRSVLIATGLETAFHAWIGFTIFCVLSIQFDQPITWLYSLGIPITLLFLKVFISVKSKQIQIPPGLRLRSGLILFLLFLLTWLTSAPFLVWIIQGISGQPAVPVLEIWKIWIISSIFSYIGSYTLGGLGVVREFSMVFLLGRYFSPPVCLVIAVMSRIIITLGNLIWPGILIVLLKSRQAAAKAAEKRLKRPD